MNILAISDLHGKLPDLKDYEDLSYDVLTIPGDICPNYRENKFFECKAQAKWLDTEFRTWLDSIRARNIAKRIVATWGNHDWVGYLQSAMVPTDLPWDLLVDKHINIDDCIFYGCPWSPEFCGWAFMRSDSDLKTIYSKIPPNTHVLLSHSPPEAYCDKTITGEFVGSKPLADILIQESYLPNLKLVLCGHIHEAVGVKYIEYAHRLPLKIINCSMVNEHYEPVNKPFEASIDPSIKWNHRDHLPM